MSYVFSKQINQPIAQAIEILREALINEHLGIVSDVDVSGIIKNKLGESMPDYHILGVCNPNMAKTMINEVPEVGVLLPCVVVVRSVGENTTIDVMDPVPVLDMVNNETVNNVASQAKIKLQTVLASL